MLFSWLGTVQAAITSNFATRRERERRQLHEVLPEACPAEQAWEIDVKALARSQLGRPTADPPSCAAKIVLMLSEALQIKKSRSIQAWIAGNDSISSSRVSKRPLSLLS